jgi:O-acetyl-ADP-ribose deacetylase (regulator of RNase III)
MLEAEFERVMNGNLLTADAEALVNTVNTVGVMGKGIALQFKKAFPENFKDYKRACDHGEVQPGTMFVHQTGTIAYPHLIINFPTKRHWKGKSKLQDITAGLDDLVRVLRDHHITSVAVPPLGCGNGGLDWAEVRPLIEDALKPVSGLKVLLHEPAGAPAPQTQPIATKPSNMTVVRAVVLAALDSYQSDPSNKITALVAQKMSYLAQTAGQSLKLDFAKGKYGPYSEKLQHVLQGIDGHFITGAGDRTGQPDIALIPQAVEQAWIHLADHDREASERINRVYGLIDGFDSPFGLELLTTVHWASDQEGATTPREALAVVSAWTERKARTFPERHVNVAWERLADHGWLTAESR